MPAEELPEEWEELLPLALAAACSRSQALRRFAKIDLQPGEEQEVVFTLTPRDISRYSPELHAWCAAPGRYEIRIGHSSRDIRAVLALQYTDAKI